IAHVRAQLPLDARPYSLPEPDLAVVRGEPRDYRDRHPTGPDTLLAVEIARTSQALDRRKAGIYAAAGVPVYWLIDLARGQVEVFSGPTEESGYERHEILVRGQEVALPGLDTRWPVAELVG